MGEELKTFIDRYVFLEPQAWESLQSILKVKTIKKKELFLRQGEICRSIGFIIKGYMRLYYLQSGEEITKDFNFENSFCGSYASFSLQQASRFNVVAMEDTKIYTIGRDDLYHLYDTYPSLQKFGRISIEHMFVKKEKREASFLLDSAELRYKTLIEQDPKIVLRVPLKYLASYLGISAETLSRIRNSNS